SPGGGAIAAAIRARAMRPRQAFSRGDGRPRLCGGADGRRDFVLSSSLGCRGMTQLRELVRRAPRRRPVMPGWFVRLASAGIVSKDPQIIRRQRCANVAAYVGAISGLSYIVLTTAHDLRGLWPLNIHNALLVVSGLFL